MTASAGRLDDAQKSANAFFKGKTFTAKVDLKHQGKHDVDPDGKPTEGKAQGRHRRNRGMFVRDVAFATGTGGRGIYIRVDESDQEIKVTLTPKRGIGMHFSDIYIHFDRPLVEADIDPRSIARSVAAYVEFEGVTVGGEIAAALDEIDQAENAHEPTTQNSAAQNTKPTVVKLTAAATPAVLRSGGEALLELSFEISTPGSEGTDVTERRTLTVGGVTLPGYPVETVESRAAGQHTTSYRQPIPSSATAGIYEYRGEVCVSGDCISRTTTFRLEP